MKSENESQDLESRIREHYERLPPAEKRLGNLLLNFPGDIATYSATELAGMAGTSKAAATRLFRRLGYSDFNEVRHSVRAAQRWGSPVYLTSQTPPQSRSRLIAEHLARESENLSRTLEGLRPDAVREIGKTLSKAQHVFVAGFRNSHFLAQYLYRQLALMRSDIRLIPAPGQTLGEDLVDIGEHDLLVIVGLRRRIDLTLRLMEVARKRGARILLIADPSAVAAAKLATWTVTCEVRSISPFDSYVAAMSIINLVCALLFRDTSTDAQQRLQEIETLHEALEELDSSAPLQFPLPPDT
ncbi:MAG: MurR/RpiR family transcriptional regulator [Acidihalobacter sp.]|jgi:DNA-binding MurR/RpiR family transcriptional regulator|uniref:MurR/RpiR family transcriptional regulator n=1 Tax=Acidihalobacter sp. TaxID=1872108 RepID=UPI00307F4D57